jgi:hypothetical protein
VVSSIGVGVVIGKDEEIVRLSNGMGSSKYTVKTLISTRNIKSLSESIKSD